MRIRRYYKAVRLHVRDGLAVSLSWSWPSMVLPRVQVLLSPGGTDEEPEDHLCVALELSDQGGDPVLDLCVEFAWPFSRPYQCELVLPPKNGRSDLHWRWRQPWEPIQQ